MDDGNSGRYAAATVFVSVDSGYPGLVLPTRTNSPDRMPARYARPALGTHRFSPWFTCADVSGRRTGATTAATPAHPSRQESLPKGTVDICCRHSAPRKRRDLINASFSWTSPKLLAAVNRRPETQRSYFGFHTRPAQCNHGTGYCQNRCTRSCDIYVFDKGGDAQAQTSPPVPSGCSVNFKGNKAASLFNPPSTLAVKFDTALMTRLRRWRGRSGASWAKLLLNPWWACATRHRISRSIHQESILNGTCYRHERHSAGLFRHFNSDSRER